MPCFSAEQLDALLPQTQCGLCGYGGCLPYAKAMAEANAPFHLCPPGGVPTLLALAELLEKNPIPFIDDMEKNAKPLARARIREAECIGCTKCIQACPVDAILGSAKQMHTVIAMECTGCELCIAPCPVDCIDMVMLNKEENPVTPAHARQRFYAREARLAQEKSKKKSSSPQSSLLKKRQYIEEAIARAQIKKANVLSAK